MVETEYEVGQELPLDTENVLVVKRGEQGTKCSRCHFLVAKGCSGHSTRCGLDLYLVKTPMKGANKKDTSRSKYNVTIKGVTVDVYDVLKAFNVECPALQHLTKKALKAGARGHKDLMTDLDDIIFSAKRAKELAK